MKVVLQRVRKASVKVNGEVVGSIEQGLLVLVGFGEEESKEAMQKMAKKIVNLRIFNDEDGIMNVSVNDIKGELLVVSQFTLMASTKKGNRPSYIEAAKPDIANIYYEQFLDVLGEEWQKPIERGIFGADMKVDLLNDGPVTILLES